MELTTLNDFRLMPFLFLIVASLIIFLSWKLLRFRRQQLAIKAELQQKTDVYQHLQQQHSDLQRELNGILDNLQDTYYRTDVNGFVTFASQSVVHLLGYTPQEVVGKKLSDLYIHVEDREIFLQNLQKSGGHLEQYEAIMRHKDDSEVWVSTNAHFLRDTEQNIIGVEGTGRDITAHKRSEEALIKTRDQAEKANGAKSLFLANMSHEIRTPLNGITGFANLLGRTRLNIEQNDYVETIQTSVKDLLNIINDILDFSRIESGKMELHEDALNINSCVAAVTRLFSAMAEHKNLNLKLNISEQIPSYIQADSLRLKQILSNLISNAIKFTPQGSILVKASMKNADILIEVIDSGVGIDKQQQTSLFKAFTQIDDELYKDHAGAGLGLAISKKLIEMMGGTIGVDSEHGHGANFWITLPAKTADSPVEKSTYIKQNEALNFTDKNVLVVDDNAINRKLISILLGQKGIQVSEAEDGFAALDIIQKKTFSLILMDIRMPEINGMEVTKKIRHEKNPNQCTPIIALTAHALPHERQAFLDAGMEDCVTKPVSETELLNIIEQYQK